MSDSTSIKDLKERLSKLENAFNKQLQVQITDKYELRELITQAVDIGNDKILAKIENLEKRIIALENKDGEKAKAVLQSILITTLGWFVLGLLNNLPLFINK